MTDVQLREFHYSLRLLRKLAGERSFNIQGIQGLKAHGSRFRFTRFPAYRSFHATGRPMLANDPHRPVQLPSLRKTVHLVAPGWNAIGAGEPALPGIACVERGIGAEYHAMGINPAYSQERFAEAHDLIVRAWTEPGPFSYVGKHYQFKYVNPC
ncbi:hypothetical protein B4Q13_23090, partial [Lacticaseibacillus rhamnosus]